MVKMKALKTFGFAGANEGPVKRGREFVARDMRRAQELEAHGLAYRLDTLMQPEPLNKMLPVAHENEAAEHGPLGSAGGETGAAETAPSSPQGRRRRFRRSASSGDDLLS